MFSAVMDKDKIKRWIKFVTTIDKLTEEACFWLSSEGIMFRDMDPARISMINFSLSREYFVEYSYEGEEQTPICLQSKKLLEFSKLLKNSDELELRLEDGGGHLILGTKTPYEKYLMLPVVIDRDRNLPGIPELNYTARIKMVSTSLKDALNEAKAISDRITFIAEGNSVTFLSRNDEGFQVKNRLTYPDNLEILEINVDEKSVAVYMVKPLLDVVKEISTLSRIIEMKFGNTLPLDINFELIEGEKYEYFLAPRTEE